MISLHAEDYVQAYGIAIRSMAIFMTAILSCDTIGDMVKSVLSGWYNSMLCTIDLNKEDAFVRAFADNTLIATAIRYQCVHYLCANRGWIAVSPPTYYNRESLCQWAGYFHHLLLTARWWKGLWETPYGVGTEGGLKPNTHWLESRRVS